MSLPSLKLLVATTNPKKLIELRTLVADLGLDLLCLSDLPGYTEVPETGTTFQENAILKARGYAAQTGCLTLGEDSGLSCDALNGAPGVYSARFAGEDKDDAANNDQVLNLMKPIPDDHRGAHFISAVALADAAHLIGVVEGKVDGQISREVVGSNGFGYDPIFYYPPFGKTFGQVPSEMKHQVSHRAEALKKAKTLLRDYLRK